MAILLLDGMGRPRRLIADKAYDADRLRRWLKTRRIRAVMPSGRSRNRPCPPDRPAYRRRNVIERMFGRLKNRRRIATRYDRLASNHPSALALAAVVGEWI
jgi:transposase